MAEMLSTTRYIALVRNKPRSMDENQPPHVFQITTLPNTSLDIHDDATGKLVQRLHSISPIQRVRISKTHLVVALNHTVMIYSMKKPMEKLVAYETAHNPFGLCCLGNDLVVFPGVIPGQVRMYNLVTNEVHIIYAHRSSLRAIALSRDEKRVATASTQGTLIRVFSIPFLKCVAEFRRGIDKAVILSLAFSPDRQLLAATSDKSTLHIFEPSIHFDSDATNKWGFLSKLPLLPRQFSDTYSSATIKFRLSEEHSGAPTCPGLKDEVLDAVPGSGLTQGLIGWVDDQRLVVVGAGLDPVWEIFRVTNVAHSSCVIELEAWKRYLD